jgi:hypothetical protein
VAMNVRVLIGGTFRCQWRFLNCRCLVPNIVRWTNPAGSNGMIDSLETRMGDIQSNRRCGVLLLYFNDAGGRSTTQNEIQSTRYGLIVMECKDDDSSFKSNMNRHPFSTIFGFVDSISSVLLYPDFMLNGHCKATSAVESHCNRS